MASMLFIFSLLTGIKVGYKTVERLYSDPEVYLALCNLHRLILKKKGIKECDVSGDGADYSLSISKHYREEGEPERRQSQGKK
jgi:transposase